MIQKLETIITPFRLSRTCHLYLPDDWQTSGKRYPVLYMFDGHNLFFDSYATYGKSWGLKEYLDARKAQLIVVGVECNHEGTERLSEYCPYDVPSDWWGGFEGKGKDYMDWMVTGLKPHIDTFFPTLPDREHTLIGGSSMGGLMSLYAVACYNDTFSRAACLSPSVRLCMEEIYEDVASCKIAAPTKAFISWGTEEVKSKKDLAYATDRNLSLGNLLVSRGALVYQYLHLKGHHCEADWEEEIPLFMEFLFDDIETKEENP